MRVKCAVEETEIVNDEGVSVASVCVTCSRCNHEATAYGTSERSVKRALMTLRDECPEDETNSYAADDEGGESAMPDPVVRPWWEKK